MKKFKYPLAIEGTTTQLLSLIPELEKLGYVVWKGLREELLCNHRYNWLITYSHGSVITSLCSNAHVQTEASNPSLVLALAAMVDDEKFYEGEIVKITGGGGYCIHPSAVGRLGHLTEVAFDGIMGEVLWEDTDEHSTTVSTFNPPIIQSDLFLRKATKEEIINHFNHKQMSNAFSVHNCCNDTTVTPKKHNVLISADFVKKAHKAACEDWKEKIEDAVPELFPKTTYKLGDRFKIPTLGNDIYLLAGDGERAVLVNMADGVIFKTTAVKDVNAITEHEIYLMTDGRGFKKLA